MALTLTQDLSTEQQKLFSPEALQFVEKLVRKFDAERRACLARREERQKQLDAGHMPDFLEETRNIRESEWTVAPIPTDLTRRRVEITGPVERKMVINALNSGADVFMADFEDANSPTWSNVAQGQVNLYDAIRRTITFVNPQGKQYALHDEIATLLVRPRGWHLPEKHVLLDGQPISASLLDFGIYFFHNARELLNRGSGPYFYLPKLESHLEARLWNDVFVFAQEELGVPQGSIRATVLIETILAAFEMDEILHELRDHSAGLNCGRWDYIFSIIKRFSKHKRFVMPNRGLVTMMRHNMRAYSLLAIQTCHRRGIHAIGGMAAQIPIKNDPEANEKALAAVRADKEREAGDGHDGTWVAHPGLVPIALKAFDAKVSGSHQIHRRVEDVQVTAEDLLHVPDGEITAAGVDHNIDVAIRYMAAWLAGNGCVPIYHLMEDAATAEISRSQLWQWLHHRVSLSDGGVVDEAWLSNRFDACLQRIRAEMGADVYQTQPFTEAARVIQEIVWGPEFTEFMTSVGYEQL